MSAVKTVTEKISAKTGDKNATLTLEDGSQVWTPSYDKALPLIGKEIPSEWTVSQGTYGPMAFPPGERKGGGGGFGGKASWYNSEAGTRFTQERMDRRTALMQAVETYGSRPPNMRLDQYIEAAELFYDWLRESSVPASALGKDPSVGAGTVGVEGKTETTAPSTPATNEYPADWPSEEVK